MKRGPKLIMIKKIWGKAWGGGRGNPTTKKKNNFDKEAKSDKKKWGKGGGGEIGGH